MIRSFTLLGFICLFSRSQGIQYKSYLIKSGDVPSYLYREFKEVSEKIFPRDLRIVVTLSKFSGTLFYSIDKNKTQFIVSLDNTRGPSLTIKSSKFAKSQSFMMSDLCGCDYCKGEMIDLWFKIGKEEMIVQCNGGKKNWIKFGSTKRSDKGYPNPFTDDNGDTAKRNEAHLWIVNFDGFNGVSHNSDQLVGCILNVTYGDISVNFTNVTSNIVRECKLNCVNDICNGGRCYETFNGNPRCNCTTTLLNGMYCNDTSNATNVVSESPYRFSIIKLSWGNSSNQILELQNQNTSLSVIGRSNRLIIAYRSMKNWQIQSEGILLEPYNCSNQFILIAHFNKAYINIKLHHNGSWTRTQVFVRPDIEKEIFQKLTLGSGVIDLAFKNSTKELVWKTVHIKNFTVRQTVTQTSEQCTASKICDSKTYGLVSSGNSGSIVITVIITFVITAFVTLLIVVMLERKQKYIYWLIHMDTLCGGTRSNNGYSAPNNQD